VIRKNVPKFVVERGNPFDKGIKLFSSDNPSEFIIKNYCSWIFLLKKLMASFIIIERRLLEN